MNLHNTKAAAAGLFIGTLLLGILLGVIADRTLLLPGPPFMAMPPLEARHPPERGRFMRRFAKQLELTREQQVQLDSILFNNRRKFDELRRGLHPRFSALRDSLDQQILQILTPSQREKFQALKKEEPVFMREERREPR